MLDINSCPLCPGQLKISIGQVNSVQGQQRTSPATPLEFATYFGCTVNMFKIKKYHNTIMAKIGMLEIRSFVDHKLAVFTYFKHNFSPYTSQRCDQQKLSNLACLVKQRTGCQPQFFSDTVRFFIGKKKNTACASLAESLPFGLCPGN